ncbi:MAG: hypothetical protein HYV63_04915 [Candidatus Schekmanbacteria bacterium]|nr:hypothetical protein [Candidatus Schekmanbacteria bacterium]
MLDLLRCHGALFGYSCLVSAKSWRAVTSPELVRVQLYAGCAVGVYSRYSPGSRSSRPSDLALTAEELDRYQAAFEDLRAQAGLPLLDLDDLEEHTGCFSRAGASVHVDGISGRVAPCLRVPLAPAECRIDPAGSCLADALSHPFFVEYRRSEICSRSCGANLDREAWSFQLGRPPADRALLVIHGRATRFAEEALISYLARMGQGVRPLMDLGFELVGCDDYRGYLDEEMERLGLSLHLRLSADGKAVSLPALAPIGPAVSRRLAVPIELPPGGDRVTVQLEATPRFWEIQEVTIASALPPDTSPRELRARSALLASGTDVAALLAAADGRRVNLAPGERVEVAFEAPPPAPGRMRTVIASMRGYYAIDIGGVPGINAAALLAHHLELVTLPRFAARLQPRR